MSGRAAWRLESLGFGEVYDYVGSKMDWIGEELPFEGTLADQPRLATVAERDVPTCGLDERAGDALARTGRWDLSLVVTSGSGILLGLLRAGDVDDPDRPVAEVMEEGPSTYRPHVAAGEMSDRLDEHPAHEVIVTTATGRLLGVARPEAVRRAAAATDR